MNEVVFKKFLTKKKKEKMMILIIMSNLVLFQNIQMIGV